MPEPRSSAQLTTDYFGSRREQVLAFGGDTLVDFYGRSEQRHAFFDRQIKQSRPVLITDRQDIGESAGGDERRLAPRRVIRAFVPRVVPSRTTTCGISAASGSDEQVADGDDRRLFARVKLVSWPLGTSQSRGDASRSVAPWDVATRHSAVTSPTGPSIRRL